VSDNCDMDGHRQYTRRRLWGRSLVSVIDEGVSRTWFYSLSTFIDFLPLLS